MAKVKDKRRVLSVTRISETLEDGLSQFKVHTTADMPRRWLSFIVVDELDAYKKAMAVINGARNKDIGG